VPAITDNFDLYTIKWNTNAGANYTYTVSNPPPAIPTLSEWALILLGVFLLGVGVFYIMQRRQVC
jgi:hypothetical protein